MNFPAFPRIPHFPQKPDPRHCRRPTLLAARDRGLSDSGLVLNRVNNRTIRGAYGDVCDNWAGKIIAVFPTMAEFRGTMKPALRVRIPPPKQATAGNGQTAKPATPPPAATIDPAEIDVDDELNDEINF